ncbi:hypothetical protein PVT67_11660 [Gallaecimonas kandeliae]|uniref:phage tail terminator protein n=1 Tax=Gallaecimonas kandeliae TaxID=3029055 RepID=UPI0026473300|nr:hypothetical protein [Gallaecimonas kandeliae]WKE64336.1 hypothetical protein PVT67_11660 [Gallaecimonas kandeliae]
MIAVPDLLIARLKDQFKDVEGLLALSGFQDRQVSREKLFVVELSERPHGVVDGTGLYRQDMTLTLGVLLVLPAINCKTPDLTTPRNLVRQLLFSWAPDPSLTPLALAGGQLQPSRAGTVAWLDRFTTDYTEDANYA